MNAAGILAEIDKEIARLTAARKLLANDAAELPVKRGPGRPRGGKRKLSPEGRKRIADAMKKRWAERKKQTAGKSAK